MVTLVGFLLFCRCFSIGRSLIRAVGWCSSFSVGQSVGLHLFCTFISVDKSVLLVGFCEFCLFISVSRSVFYGSVVSHLKVGQVVH